MDGNSTLSIIVKLVDEASGGLKTLSSNTRESLQSVQLQANQVRNTFGIMGGAIVAGLALAVNSASDAETKMAAFNQTLANSKKVTDAQRDAMLSAASAAVRLGFDDEDAALSTAKLYQRTGDVNEAIQLQAAAMDLARDKHLDLSSATNAVALALSGQGRALAAYGIAVKDLASPMEVLQALQGKVGGQAEAFAGTFKGQSEAMTASVDNLQEALATGLLPALTQIVQAVTPIILKLTDWMSTHPQLTKQIVTTIAIVGVLALAISALAAAISATITVVLALSAVIGALSLPLLAVIAVAALLAYAIFTHWGEIIDYTSDLMLKVSGFWTAIQTSIQNSVANIINFVEPFIARMRTAIDLAARVASIVSNPIGAATSAAFSIASNVGNTIFPHAEGGIVTRPHIGLVGEAGPEAIIPLSKMGSFGGTTVNVNITGNKISNDMDLRQITDKLSAEIIRSLRQNQRLAI